MIGLYHPYCESVSTNQAAMPAQTVAPPMSVPDNAQSHSVSSACENGHRRFSAIPRLRVELIDEPDPAERISVKTGAQVYALLGDEAARWDREHFLALVVDNERRLIGIDEVSVGTLTQTLVHPREVFKAIVLLNGPAFLVVHNHPSGNPKPSNQDIEITRNLKQVAKILDVDFLDHIVIGAGCFVSFVEDGWWRL